MFITVYVWEIFDAFCIEILVIRQLFGYTETAFLLKKGQQNIIESLDKLVL